MKEARPERGLIHQRAAKTKPVGERMFIGRCREHGDVLLTKRERNAGGRLPRAGKGAPWSMGCGVHPFEDVGRVPVTGYGVCGKTTAALLLVRLVPLCQGEGNVRSEQTWGALERTYVLWKEGTAGRGVGMWELFVC